MKRLLAITAASLTASPAFAHHALGGAPMTTATDGFVSGLAHPVLGFDHLFFIAAMGIAASFTAARLTAPLAYVAAMLAGCALTYAGLPIPLVESMIVVSLLALGGAVLSGQTLSLPVALIAFAAFGLFHGAAFGGVIAGQEGAAGAQVLLPYLLGLGLVQYAVALGAGWVTRGVLGATEASAVNARLLGAMTAGVGVFLALEAIEGPLVSAITGA